MKIKHIDISQRKCRMFLGPTEYLVISYLWRQPNSASELHIKLVSDGSKLAYNTISTTLTRLLKKGLVVKSARGEGAVIYKPVHPTETLFLKDALRQLDRKLRDDFNVSLDYS